MNTPVPATALGELKQELASARDAQIAQIVAMIDRLHDRGDADRLIAPLRGRLMQLRPARPLRFSRLLFMPIDALIVPPARWHPESLAIPRTAIVPLASTLRAILPTPLIATVDGIIAGQSTASADIVAKAGAMLWPASGAALLEAPPPQSWETTGLPQSAYKPVAQAVGALLTQAIPLRDLKHAARCGCRPDRAAGERMMRASAAHGPAAAARLLALALTQLPDAVALLRAAETRAGLTQAGGRAAAESAVAFFLDRLQREDAAASPLVACELHDAGSTVGRLHALLEELAGPTASADRRRRIAGIKQSLDASCRTRFASAIETEVLQPLQSSGAVLEDEAVTALEEAARSLRRLERAARQIGGGPSYDGLLRRTVTEVRNGSATRTLEPIDRVRLIEILAGPEQALALLNETASPDRQPSGIVTVQPAPGCYPG